jgi:ribose 5-phosphate isomerase B
VKIGIGSDHAGLKLKRAVVEHLKKQGHEVVDVGTESNESTDYPIYALKVARGVAAKDFEQGVLVCGTGTGMAIAANKVRGVRAAPATNEFLARMARAHNDANVLCLGERVVGEGVAQGIVDAFLQTPYEGGRHQRRVDLIGKAEEEK